MAKWAYDVTVIDLIYKIDRDLRTRKQVVESIEQRRRVAASHLLARKDQEQTLVLAGLNRVCAYRTCTHRMMAWLIRPKYWVRSMKAIKADLQTLLAEAREADAPADAAVDLVACYEAAIRHVDLKLHQVEYARH